MTSLFESDYDYNPLYAGGGVNDLDTDIMEAEWEDCEREMERQAEMKKQLEEEGYQDWLASEIADDEEVIYA